MAAPGRADARQCTTSEPGADPGTPAADPRAARSAGRETRRSRPTARNRRRTARSVLAVRCARPRRRAARADGRGVLPPEWESGADLRARGIVQAWRQARALRAHVATGAGGPPPRSAPGHSTTSATGTHHQDAGFRSGSGSWQVSLPIQSRRQAFGYRKLLALCTPHRARVSVPRTSGPNKDMNAPSARSRPVHLSADPRSNRNSKHLRPAHTIRPRQPPPEGLPAPCEPAERKDHPAKPEGEGLRIR